jgi:plasmid stabilization system protein ParE
VAERSVRFHPEAERDLDEGLRFYLGRSALAAERFLADVEAALALLQEAPERWPLFHLGTRRFVMAAFP